MTGDERVALSVALEMYRNTVKDSFDQHTQEVKMNKHDRLAQENLQEAKQDLQTIHNLQTIFGM